MYFGSLFMYQENLNIRIWCGHKEFCSMSWQWIGVAAWIGGEFAGEWIHMCIWLGRFAVYLKLSQHCYLAILQYKIKSLNNEKKNAMLVVISSAEFRADYLSGVMSVTRPSMPAHMLFVLTRG